MHSKSDRVALLLQDLPVSGSWDPRYLGYFRLLELCRYYEAHDVLEDLWLERRLLPEGNFYKALIQVAGALVHAQKSRWGPGIRLLRLAAGYFSQYSGRIGGLPAQKLSQWCLTEASLWQLCPPEELPRFPFWPEEASCPGAP
jgi:hypothetical protein